MDHARILDRSDGLGNYGQKCTFRYGNEMQYAGSNQAFRIISRRVSSSEVRPINSAFLCIRRSSKVGRDVLQFFDQDFDRFVVLSIRANAHRDT